ncbi:MAG: polysaccharide biosynthesis tyrosine autokinase [Planctomycetes bacterium]|nr:polysaccharide biosynthesis tyrosine autokinase [Planctomycetota bacterium]
MAAREEKLLSQYSQMEKMELDRMYQEYSQNMTAVEADIQTSSARQADVEQKVADYQALTQEITDLNSQLDRYENKINSTSALKRNPGHIQIRVLSYGEVPLVVSSPLLKIFLPGGVIFGIMLSLGMMFLLENLDDTIKSPGDVMRYLPVPMLGMIPEHEENDYSEGSAVEKLSITQPQSLLSESYRQLKTSLQFSAPADSVKSLLLTGVTASSGTTTTAVNMSVTLVKSGKRVLLIDANFHRPKIRKLFGISTPSNGLSHYLVGQKDAPDVIRNSNLKGLDLVESGPQPPNPSDLLDSDRMRQFLSQQKDRYDYVVIDGPPSLLVSEARVLGNLVDGSILVVHAGQTSRGVVLRMIREFKSSNIRILGLVLNAVRPRKGGYFREAFDSYYDYVGGELDGRDKLEEELVSSGKMDTGSKKIS